ncbi:DUF4136 domain-containing protein [Ekhidna sp.]|uniref:DUF4136 domain-containing protein n=1 Tax=Ekhidna sp. TaxID=2608089 RepID=UPI0035151BE1
MKKWLYLIILFSFGCNPKVVSYINPKAKFVEFETYRIVSAKLESKNVTPDNTMILDLIKQNIHKQMKVRSYEQSNITPDLTLRYEITSSTRVENRSNQVNPYSFTPYQINSRTIYESVLLLELLDSKEKLVWQGSYDLSQEKKEKKMARAIEKAVGYIFTTYPYRALTKDPDEALKTIEKKKKEDAK